MSSIYHSRREFLALSLVTASSLSTLMFPKLGFASAKKFTLQPLPYDYKALEPYIDEKTMHIHHSRHHQAYVNNLNLEIEQDRRLAGLTLDRILASVSQFSTASRNNAGGHYNHQLFWQIMTSPGSGGQPSIELHRKIQSAFTSTGQMIAKINQAALAQFGSGWVWLILNNAGSLEITATPNQDNPLMDIAPVKGFPLLGIDVWEHAYYLKYQNNRAEYLNNWWSLTNWNEINKRFAEAVKSG